MELYEKLIKQIDETKYFLIKFHQFNNKKRAKWKCFIFIKALFILVIPFVFSVSTTRDFNNFIFIK